MRSLVALLILVITPLAHANARPEARPDRYTLRQGESLDVRPPGVLSNDTDMDGDALFLEPASTAMAGQLILFPDGSFSYTPDARFERSDRFTYRACDGQACSDPIEVLIEGDGIAAPLASRPDRFEQVAGGGAIELDVLENDAFDPARMAGARLEVVSAASLGDLEVLAGAPVGLRLRYRPRDASVGLDRFRYRLCEAAGRCTEADVDVRILPIAPVLLDVSGAAGSADLAFRGLPTLPAPRLMITGTSKVSRVAFPISVDRTPLEPWAGGGAAQTLFSAEGGESGRDVRLRVVLEAEGADVDLYVGVDDDGNRRATSDEVECVSASVASLESCVIELSVPADERRTWWVHAHNREGRRVDARLQVFEVDLADTSPLAWTGPGRVEAGAASAFLVSWTDLVQLPGSTQDAWIRVDGEPGASLGWVPLTMVGESPNVAPRLLRSGDVVRFDLPAGAVADTLVFDVPEDAASFTLTAATEGDAMLALYRAMAPNGNEDSVAISPVREGQLPVATARSKDGVATLALSDNPAGRWLLRVEAGPVDLSQVAVEPRIAFVESAKSRLRPGLYGPPGRPGEGLIVDRAAGDWAGIWYAFDEAGKSTWLYLQGAAPVDGAAWAPTIYRSAMGGGGQRLATVGRGHLAILDDEGPVFSFELDGRVGSQRLADFGRGCPVDRGVPRDLSGLWYDPGVPGEGYGVWITPSYEFYGLFSHDARGQPRYLSAEGGGFNLLGSRQLPLVAYKNACIFCPRGQRMGDVVGELERSFAPALSPILARAEATFGAGVQGGLSRRDVLERLGGDTAGLGCPGP